ncbi:hypothetical protein AR457_10080 [Streptomyces agglomeratus]|nr:hypothetical protein BGK70_26575 [Streptomyces agglomeratus]OEJ44398.1 hypothetical protein AR457_10080 [Streptomyces agglomeratus]
MPGNDAIDLSVIDISKHLGKLGPLSGLKGALPFFDHLHDIQVGKDLLRSAHLRLDGQSLTILPLG